MFLVELRDHDPLTRFVARRVARWVGCRRAPSLSPEALKALARRRLGLVRYTAPKPGPRG
jgi:hypothetical protein